MSSRRLVHSGLLITSALLLLNVSSCVLARIGSVTGDLYVAALPGATPIPGTERLIYAGQIRSPSLGFADSGVAIFYADPSGTAGELRGFPFFYWVNYGGPFSVLSVAYWPLLVVFGFPSVLFFFLQRQHRRVQRTQGLCAHCDYDLSGNTPGLCPECGHSTQPTRLPVPDRVLAGIRRNRRSLKWFGLLASLAMAGLWSLSNWLVIGHIGRDTHVYVWQGSVSRGRVEGDLLTMQGWKVRSRPFFDHSARQELLALWPALLLLGVPTTYLWLLDRRRVGASHCATCLCDLTGSMSGVCPECGAKVASAES